MSELTDSTKNIPFQVSKDFISDLADRTKLLSGLWYSYVSVPADKGWEFDGTANCLSTISISKDAIVTEATDFATDKVLVVNINHKDPTSYNRIIFFYQGGDKSSSNYFDKGSGYWVAGCADISEFSKASYMLKATNGDNYIFIDLSYYPISCVFDTNTIRGDGANEPTLANETAKAETRVIYQHYHNSVSNYFSSKKPQLYSASESLDPYSTQTAMFMVIDKARQNATVITMSATTKGIVQSETYLLDLPSNVEDFNGNNTTLPLMIATTNDNGEEEETDTRLTLRGQKEDDEQTIDGKYQSIEFLFKNYYFFK